MPPTPLRIAIAFPLLLALSACCSPDDTAVEGEYSADVHRALQEQSADFVQADAEYDQRVGDIETAYLQAIAGVDQNVSQYQFVAAGLKSSKEDLIAQARTLYAQASNLRQQALRLYFEADQLRAAGDTAGADAKKAEADAKRDQARVKENQAKDKQALAKGKATEETKARKDADEEAKKKPVEKKAAAKQKKPEAEKKATKKKAARTKNKGEQKKANGKRAQGKHAAIDRDCADQPNGREQERARVDSELASNNAREDDLETGGMAYDDQVLAQELGLFDWTIANADQEIAGLDADIAALDAALVAELAAIDAAFPPLDPIAAAAANTIMDGHHVIGACADGVCQ